MDNNTNTVKKTTITSQKRIIAVLGAVVLVLAIVYAVVVSIKNDYSLELPLYDEQGDLLDYSYTSESGSKVEVVSRDETTIVLDADSKINYTSRPYIYPEIAVDDVKEITVSNQSGEFTLSLDSITGSYIIKGNEMQIYNKRMISDLRTQARFMLAIQKIEGEYQTEESLEPFGLDTSSAPVMVTVTDVNGKSNTVFIGDSLVTGAAYYAKSADKPYIYVLDSSVSQFFSDKLSYIEPIITAPMTQNEYQLAESFNINRNGEPFIASSIVPEEQRTGTGDTDLHKLTYPAKYPASITNYYEALACFTNLTGTAVVDTNLLQLSDEEFAATFEKYGFTVPTNDVQLLFNGEERRFLTGTRFVNDDGSVYYYAYSPYLDTVVTLPLENAPFLEYELMDFIDSSIFQMNINNVSEIKAHVPGISAHFVLEGEGKDLKVTDTVSGKVIDTASFRQFFISMLTVKIEGYASDTDVTGKNEFGFTVVSKYGETSSYEFDIISTTRSLISLDGSAEFYTNRSFVTSASEKLLKLMTGEKITPDY